MRRPLSLLLCLFCLAASPAQAHKVNLFALVEGGRIVGEGFFSGGDKARNSPVEVYDAAGKLAAETRTDEAGAFSLPAPADAAPPLRLVLKAGEGHQNDYVLTAQDLGRAAAPTPSVAAKTPEPAGAAEAKAPAAATELRAADAGQIASDRSPDQMEEAIGRVLDAKLAPLRQQLLRLEERSQAATPRDVVGGLGWIIGLFGLAAWMRRPRG